MLSIAETLQQRRNKQTEVGAAAGLAAGVALASLLAFDRDCAIVRFQPYRRTFAVSAIGMTAFGGLWGRHYSRTPAALDAFGVSISGCVLALSMAALAGNLLPALDRTKFFLFPSPSSKVDHIFTAIKVSYFCLAFLPWLALIAIANKFTFPKLREIQSPSSHAQMWWLPLRTGQQVRGFEGESFDRVLTVEERWLVLESGNVRRAYKEAYARFWNSENLSWDEECLSSAWPRSPQFEKKYSYREIEPNVYIGHELDRYWLIVGSHKLRICQEDHVDRHLEVEFPAPIDGAIYPQIRMRGKEIVVTIFNQKLPQALMIAIPKKIIDALPPRVEEID